MKRHFIPVRHERHCFLHTFSRTILVYFRHKLWLECEYLHSGFYLWPFPDNPSGLGRVWSQFLISQWSAPSWKAVVLKQAPTPQTLFVQSLIILAWELHRMPVGADALLPLLLVSQSICPGCHPQLKSVKRRPEGRLCFARAYSDWPLSRSSTGAAQTRCVFVLAWLMQVAQVRKSRRLGGAGHGQVEWIEGSNSKQMCYKMAVTTDDIQTGIRLEELNKHCFILCVHALKDNMLFYFHHTNSK